MTNQILATDLDGTLIPLAGDSENRRDLQRLSELLHQHQAELVFVTGRHFESVIQAIDEFSLPRPSVIICDVGSSIHQSQADGGFAMVQAYVDHQADIVGDTTVKTLRTLLDSIAELRLQDEVCQGTFKLSYFADPNALDQVVDQLHRQLQDHRAPWSVISSVDPFTGTGLIDLLPAGVSKSHALAWWIRQCDGNLDSLIFAGDSGNDLAALTAGYRSIVVGNADRKLAEKVQAEHRQSGWTDRLYLAENTATSGVLEGCLWYWK